MFDFNITVFYRYLSRHDFILWPSFRLSFPEIQSGPIINELVFTGPSMTTNCHMTHKIVPVISDDGHKRHHVVKKNSPRQVKHPLSPTKDPTSPTKHPHSPTKYTNPQLKSPGPAGECSPNLHSPPKIKSPTKHHPHGGGHHHKPHPHHHTHQRHHHHHHHKHHSKHDGVTEAYSSEQATDSAATDEKSQVENAMKKEVSSSGKNKTILRTLQPTSPPKFLLAYVPRVRFTG